MKTITTAEAKVELVRRLCTWLKSLGDDLPVFHCRSLTQTAVFMQSGGYRNKPINGGQELFLSDVVIGKSGKILFHFEPADAQEWTRCEFPEDKIDDVIVGFADAIRQHVLVGDDLEASDVGYLLDRVKTDLQAAQQKIEEERKKEREAADRKIREDNEYWGMF